MLVGSGPQSRLGGNFRCVRSESVNCNSASDVSRELVGMQLLEGTLDPCALNLEKSKFLTSASGIPVRPSGPHFMKTPI